MRRTTPLEQGELSVKRSSTGLGLFARSLLLPGRYIEYVGPLLTTQEADELAHTRYLFEVNARWTINGGTRTNLARYINHSCAPNCEALQEGKRIFIKVIKTILPGEELGYDYGDEYFDEFIKPYGCKCGACKNTK